MKKNKVLKSVFATILACGGILAAATSLNVAPVGADLQVSTEDKFNEQQGIKRIDVKKAVTTGTIDSSKVLTQCGYDGSNYYLRFATAVKGDLQKIVYNASVEGSDTVLPSKVVTSVYKSITAGGERYYYNGNGIIDTALATTHDYYWACYTIKFAENSKYKNSKINVTVDINDGSHVGSRKTSLNSLLNIESDYTLGNYVTDYTAKGVSPEWTFKTMTSGYLANNTAKFEITQGGCTDGKYLYYAMNTAGNEGDTKNSAGYIVKYDVETKSVVDVSEQVGTIANNENGLGNANLFYHPKYNKIYSFGLVRACGNNAKPTGFSSDYEIDPSDLSVTKIGDIRDLPEFKFETPSMETYFDGKSDIILDVDNIEYNAELDRYAVIYRAYVGSHTTTLTPAAEQRRMFFYDGNLKLVEGITQNVKVHYASNTNYSIQELSSDSNYLYIDYTKYGKGESYIRIYDWSGNFVNEVCINGTNKFSTNSTAANIQNVMYFKGDLYFAAYQSTTGLHVCKVSYPNLSSSTEESEQEDVSAKLSYGETVEYASLNKTSVSLASSRVKSELIKVDAEISLYGGVGVTDTKTYNNYFASKGATTDGTYIYQILNANTGSSANSGFDVGIIAKMDTNGNVLAYTANSYYWGNSARIGVIDGKLVVTRTNANASSYANTKAYSGVTLAFDLDLNLVSENYKVDGITAPENSEVSHISTSVDGSKLAIIYKVTIDGTQYSKLYTYEKDAQGNYVELASNVEITTCSAGDANSTSINSLNQLLARDNYIYLMYTTAAKGIYKVIDYAGNSIDTRLLNTQGEGTHTSKNYQGFVEVDNKLYLSTCEWVWNGDPTGFYFYKITY